MWFGELSTRCTENNFLESSIWQKKRGTSTSRVDYIQSVRFGYAWFLFQPDSFLHSLTLSPIEYEIWTYEFTNVPFLFKIINEI
jgi:hypothetical protein